MPTGIIVGAGILDTPDEFTDEYNDNKLLDRVANWSRPMVVTLGRQGDEGAEKRTAQFWPIDVVDSGMHEIDTRTVYIPFDFDAQTDRATECGRCLNLPGGHSGLGGGRRGRCHNKKGHSTSMDTVRD